MEGKADVTDPRIDAEVLAQVLAEVARARSRHGNMQTVHEAYAVILEELEEAWEEIKRKNYKPVALRAELAQTAAMCVRAISDLGLWAASPSWASPPKP